MTTAQYIMTFVLILSMLIGLWLAYRGIKQSMGLTVDNDPIPQTDKNGIPILPRHERHIVTSNPNDTLEAEEVAVDLYAEDTIFSPDRQQLNSLKSHHGIQINPLSSPSENKADSTPVKQEHLNDGLKGYSDSTRYNSHNDTTLLSSTDDVQLHNNLLSDINDKEPDIFSSLASATENLMPVVQSAPEPKFEQYSPVIDEYLKLMSKEDQNSPIENAEDTVEVVIMPKNGFERFSGQELLELVEQFGMRYGLMNLFHRYENKDGTGLLWFTMIGMNRDGMTPFFLNEMPHSEYHGIALFLSLPHPRALQGFDSMMSVAGLIAKQLDARITNEAGDLLTRDDKQRLRNRVQDYMQNR